MNNRILLKIAWIAIIVFFIIIISTVVVNFLYLYGFRQNIQPNTMLSSSDIVGFIGSIGGSVFGALIAILGVYWTIQQNQEITKDEINKSIFPLLVINRLYTKFEGNPLVSMIADQLPKDQTTEKEEGKDIPLINDMQLIEMKIENLFFILSNEKIETFPILSEQQIERINQSWVNSTIYIPCFITNVGKGAAINTSIQLYKYREKRKLNATSEPIHIKENMDLKIGFYCSEAFTNYGKYKLEIKYFDLYNNEHCHIHDVTFTREMATITTGV